MVWAGGTQTITHANNVMKIVTTTLDADAEVATVIDFSTYSAMYSGKLPKGKGISMSVVQTAGTTNTVAISFQGANDAAQYRDVVDLVACEQGAAVGTISGCVAASEMMDVILTHGRVYLTTRGGANVLKTTTYVDYYA